MQSPFRCVFIGVLCALLNAQALAQDEQTSVKTPTVARQWTDALLFAIRLDLARPTVHARNLHHLSVAMYDAWSLYDPVANQYFISPDARLTECQLSTEQRESVLATTMPTSEAQKIALGHAAWELLRHRFITSARRADMYSEFDSVADMQALEELEAVEAMEGTTQDLSNPALVGIRVAACVIAQGLQDNANEINNYANIDYEPVNPPLDPTLPGNAGDINPNRWQPLQLFEFIDQSGNVTGTPSFLGADWGQLRPFALEQADSTLVNIDGMQVPVWLNPGAPPQLTDDPDANRTFQLGHAMVVQWSAHLDATDNVMIDISPSAIGNLDLTELPNTQADILAEFNGIDGGLFRSAGHEVNPETGEAYPPIIVPRGDFTRVLAEFWADGPDSETPPGHWFSVYNEAVVSHADHQTRLQGEGDLIDPLEYDVLAYLALGGALHDSAIAAWSVKRAYDSSRPLTAIRYMAGLGQSSDLSASNYHIHGIPLIDGLIETVATIDPLAGVDGINVGKIKARAWRGPDFIENRFIDEAGVDWILLENWWPYQRPTFVTPPFAGYVSGHSTFSRAAAEVLTALTGDAFFPGGYAEFVARENDFLVFEKGPSVDISLQWATYRDAADQTSLSRIWGGIHPPADDIVARRMGETAGVRAWQKALGLKTGEVESTANRPIDFDQPTVLISSKRSVFGCSVSGTTNGAGLPLVVVLFGLIWWYRRSCNTVAQAN